MSAILAGDIGGTKTLLALYRLGPAGELELQRSERYISADWSGLEPMVRTFLSGEAAPPAAACLAVAGPVAGGRAQLTNLSWQLDEARLQDETAIPRVELVNDFAVLIHGLAHLAPHQQAQIRAGTAQDQAPLLVLGAGTGLGVAYGVPSPAGLVAMASEAAHGEFAPRSQAEWELKQWLGRELGLERVSIERVVSGTGLGIWLAGCCTAAIPAGITPSATCPSPATCPRRSPQRQAGATTWRLRPLGSGSAATAASAAIWPWLASATVASGWRAERPPNCSISSALPAF